MIEFNYETNFELHDVSNHENWIKQILHDYGFDLGEITYIFCDDAYLNTINQKFLNHDDLTDIISFDYTVEKTISGDIFISVERVKENAGEYSVTFEDELLRVMSHGLLHFMGFQDKNKEDQASMRLNEEICIKKYLNN